MNEASVMKEASVMTEASGLTDDRDGINRTSEGRRREKARANAQVALDKAGREHAKRAADIQAEVEALEKRSRAEGKGTRAAAGRAPARTGVGRQGSINHRDFGRKKSAAGS
jgi:hypothetical protein